MSQEGYIPGTCNLGKGEISRRRMVAALGLVLSISALLTFISTGASREARLGIFIPLLVMSIGWVQSRKKFCLAYGFAGTFNFGKMVNYLAFRIQQIVPQIAELPSLSLGKAHFMRQR